MNKQTIATANTPAPAASYSQGLRVGSHLYLAGQGGVDVATGELVGPGVEEQTRQALQNLKNVIEAADGSISDVVSVRVFISDHSEFEGMNKAYGQVFQEPYPVRTTVSAGLAPGMKVEIEAIAFLEG